MKSIFIKPTSLNALYRLIDNTHTQEALDEVTKYAVDLARAEGYPDPVQQAECWLEDAPINI